MRFHVEITARAERDLDDILAWITARSPQGARAWLDSFEHAVEFLFNSADRCLLAPEDGYGGMEVRQLIFKTRRGKPYRLLLTIREQTVFVRHVRGPGQDLVSPEEVETWGR